MTEKKQNGSNSVNNGKKVIQWWNRKVKNASQAKKIPYIVLLENKANLVCSCDTLRRENPQLSR